LTFEPYLAPLIAILQCNIDSLRISDRLLEQCLRSLRCRIEKKRKHLATLSDCDPTSNAQQIKDLEEIYSIDNTKNDLEEDRLAIRVDDLSKREEECRSYVTRVQLKRTTIVRKRWYIPGTLLFTNQFVFTYDGPIPFLDIQEDLADGTRAIVLLKTPERYKAVYTADDLALFCLIVRPLTECDLCEIR
jgi:hypothetical protein